MRRFLPLLFLLSVPLVANPLPIDWAGNWPAQCLPTIPDLGPYNDNFEAIVALPASEVASLASCPIPSENWGTTPYDLIAVAFHQAYTDVDELSDQAWEFGNPSGPEVAYIWEEDPPLPGSSVPEPVLWPVAFLILSGALARKRFRRNTR